MPHPTQPHSHRHGAGMFALARRLRRRSRDDERGASLVEFALVFPVFLLFIIGIIEFSFVLAQNSELRHLAREGARIAAVEDISSQAITDILCERLGVIDPANFRFKADGVAGSGGDPEGSTGAIGTTEASTVQVRTITGWFDSLGFDLSSTSRFYVEAPEDAAPVWWSITGTPLACGT